MTRRHTRREKRSMRHAGRKSQRACLSPLALLNFRLYGELTECCPSPEQIAERAAEVRERGFIAQEGTIREPWSEAEKMKRAGIADAPVEIPGAFYLVPLLPAKEQKRQRTRKQLHR
jgi:hypothetical protein